ncbi:MAG: alpha/beta hydrolase [Terricaulis sp.]|nr:alpha/beta hydrolase [Terricaulis sp.]
MEKVAIDLGRWIAHAREELGYERVVLVGWSGGGSLSLFYQAQAERPTITHTPAGDAIDLTQENLGRADGVIFIAAHLSRAETLTEWIDPSVIDELDPDARDPAFDIYAETASTPPYDAAFVAEFRARQVARNRRITHWCQEQLERLRKKGGVEQERAFVVHRTMCDVRWLDPSIDPNGRKPGWCYMGDPRAVNVGPVGLARFSTLRSWLSQWSYDLSNAKRPGERREKFITPRCCKSKNTADDAVPATHNPAIHAALATSDKEYVQIENATHYYIGQPELLRQCIETIVDWSRRKRLLADESAA